MKNMKIFLIIVQCMLLFYAAAAQDATAVTEMQKIRAYYNGPELKHVKGQMLLISRVNGKQKDKVDFEYWIKDNQVFSKMSYIEILSNNSIYVMVNHRKRSIYVRPASELPAITSATIFDPEQLNKLLNVKGTKTTLVKNGAVNKLTLSGLYDSRFSEINITYEASTNKIRSVHATLKEVPGEEEQKLFLQITYSATQKSNVTTLPVIFSAARYGVMDKKGDFNYTNTYESYKKL
jgi:hypothetical protein